ncbi:TPA: hypothetical protein EYP75_00305 [Candidatus Bathyarchaeota archaeon]|nr:hypothetical protein [Candidatus Bathyarchaeota archaeon]
MDRIQVNLKLEASLVKEIENLLKQGYFNSKTEAFTYALRLLIRAYKAKTLKERIDKIREGTEKLPSVTDAIIKAQKEEDQM